MTQTNPHKTLDAQLAAAKAKVREDLGYTDPRPIATLLTLADIAEEIGVTVDSIRVYHQRATKNRRAGTERPGDLPEPDDVFGRSPVWHRSTIRRWIDRRPGRGAGGGRKPSP